VAAEPEIQVRGRIDNANAGNVSRGGDSDEAQAVAIGILGRADHNEARGKPAHQRFEIALRR